MILKNLYVLKTKKPTIILTVGLLFIFQRRLHSQSLGIFHLVNVIDAVSLLKI